MKYVILGEIGPHQAGPLQFSRATLEDTQEDELNAILGELSALQLNLDREIKTPESNRLSTADPKPGSKNSQISCDGGLRTDSPDNDSGFSDNASLLSSGSSLSASGSSSGSSTTSCNQKNSPISPVLPANEDQKRVKIREALEKMRAASITRLYVKAFTEDGSSKALMIEESMLCGRVLALFADKNHIRLTSKWALVEHLPHLQMERIYEDHENMVENLLMWTRDSKNRIFFVMKEEKYDVFNNPRTYLESRLQGSSWLSSQDRNAKNSLIEEFFNQGLGVPEVEGQLYLKAEGKKAWKKFPFVLRASGLYYYSKGKVSSNLSKDLVCLSSIDINMEAYQGVGWKKKFKAPTEFGFALKPARLQVKSPRHIKYLCAEDQETLKHWMVGLRLAKHGKQLWDNYKCMEDELAQDNFVEHYENPTTDHKPIQISTQLIRAESIVNSGRDYMHESVPLRNQIAIRKLSRMEDFNSPGVPTPASPHTGREEGFESDAPVGGTIKRKPSSVLSPKIPLTFNTRSLVSEYITNAEVNPSALSQTLQRKRSGSGTSASGSSASISSSSSSSCQGSILMKPTLNMPSEPPQITSPTEDTFDLTEYESLPPPPPELLAPDCEPYCQNQPHPILVSNPTSFSVENKMYPGFVHRNVDADTSMNYKESLPKNVSFASELSQRLKTRKNVGQDNLNYTKNSLNARPVNSIPLEEPTPDFLTDLKRVMEKKWQIAQKCQVEGKDSHEILGFRFEQGSSPHVSQGADTTPNSLNNVRAWVSQHYGNSLDYAPPPTVPTYTPNKMQRQPEYSVPIVPQQQSHMIPQRPFSNQASSQNINLNYSTPHHSQHQSLVIYENIQERNNSPHYPIQHVQIRNKKPPPPIPKRADSTHLSAHFVYN